MIEEKTALLARWKARLEAAGKGFPTDVDLLDLMDRAAELRDEPGCICRSRLYTLTVDGAPFMTLCGCQLEGLRQYAVSRKAP